LFKRSLDVPYPDPTTYWKLFIIIISINFF
jgi:hypothetical protein